MTKLSQKIDELEKEYTDPLDLEKIDMWRKQISSAQLRAKFYNLEVSKQIARFLKNRIQEINSKLSNQVGMERVDNLAWHARKEENMALLSFFIKDPNREMSDIEEEVDSNIA